MALTANRKTGQERESNEPTVRTLMTYSFLEGLPLKIVTMKNFILSFGTLVSKLEFHLFPCCVLTHPLVGERTRDKRSKA